MLETLSISTMKVTCHPQERMTAISREGTPPDPVALSIDASAGTVGSKKRHHFTLQPREMSANSRKRRAAESRLAHVIFESTNLRMDAAQKRLETKLAFERDFKAKELEIAAYNSRMQTLVELCNSGKYDFTKEEAMSMLAGGKIDE